MKLRAVICFNSKTVSNFSCFDSVKMKLFQSNKEYFAIIGMSLHQSNQKYPLLNAQSLICASLLILTLVTFSIYFIFLAKSFEEYTDCVITISTVFIVAIIFENNIWKMKKMFHSITAIEDLIQRS